MVGRTLGLTDERVIEALVEALRAAGPAQGGRFIGPHHVVTDDPTSTAAVDAMRTLASQSTRPRESAS